MLCGSLDGRGVWERMNTCTHMAEPLHHEPESITTLLTVYSPVQKKRLTKKAIKNYYLLCSIQLIDRVR